MSVYMPKVCILGHYYSRGRRTTARMTTSSLDENIAFLELGRAVNCWVSVGVEGNIGLYINTYET